MPPYAFLRKQFMPLSEAKIGILTHALHYGTACFDGIRGNWNDKKKQLYLFRVPEHCQRLLRGCRLLRITLPHSVDDLCKLMGEVTRRSEFREDVYVRPLAYKSAEAIGVRLHNLEDDLLVVVTTLPPYLDTENGVRSVTSSWRRIEDIMVPVRGKISGVYVNSALAKTEAWENGFDEAILLTRDGHVSEGSGENIFLVSNGKLVTPPVSDDILPGITRDTVIALARDEMGTETVERQVDRSELYLADEVFFTGTAAHVSPVVEIDHRPVGEGKIGPLAKRLQDLYFEVIQGENPKYMKWCLPVYPE